MGKGHLGHRPSIITSIHSDDNGITWERGDIVCRHDDNIDGTILINPSETIPVQLEDSSVMLNIRSESEIDRRLIAISPDGSSNWKIRGFDNALLEPVCMAIQTGSNKALSNPLIFQFEDPSGLIAIKRLSISDSLLMFNITEESSN